MLLGVLYLQDPGNLGTLIRTATAFGWDGVFVLTGCCDPFNEKALRASRGGSLKIPTVQGSWERLQYLIESQRLKCYSGQPHVEGIESTLQTY